MDALRTLAVRIFTTVFGMAAGILLARLLGPEGKGIFTMVSLITGVYIILIANISGAITHGISRRKYAPGTVMSNALAILVAFSLASWLAAALVRIFLWQTEWWFLFFVAAGAPFAILVPYVSSSLLGLDRVWHVNQVTAASAVITGSLPLLFLLLLNREASSALWGALVGQALAGLWVFLRHRRHFEPLAYNLLDEALVRFLLGFGFQVGLVNLVGMLNYRADVFLVQSLLGMSQVGIYSVAVSASEMLWFLSGAISVAVYGKIGIRDREQAVSLTIKTMRHTLWIILPVAALLFLCANWLVRLLYGEAFQQAGTALRILVPGVAAYSLASVLSSFFTNHEGRPRVSLVIAGFSFLVNVVGCLVLIPLLGMNGGAWATSISYALSVNIFLIYFLRHTHTPLVSMIPRWQDLQTYKDLFGALRLRLAGLLRRDAP